MKRLKQVIPGLLLALGIPLSLLAVTQLLNSQSKDKTGALALMVIALPATAAGGWLAWGVYKGGGKDNSDRLKSTFFRLLMEDNGRITVMQFAKETQISKDEARQYLDQKAQEFNASAKTDDRGGVCYYFNP
jgi:large subunit ribosomal protein L7/L12